MSRRWRTGILAVALLGTVASGLYGSRLLALSDDARDALRTYTELLTAAHEHAATPVPYRDLVYASIEGMLRELDPHSGFLVPESYSEMRERQQSSFYGLGILVGIRNDQLTVITPLDGTPASRMGLRAGDVISLIGDEPTETMSLDDAVRRLKGPKDTAVQITIVRAGLDEPLELEIVRAEIPQTTVRYTYMLDDETGYIALSDFANPTTREMAEALANLHSQGMQRLLLDLRGNGGGLLDQAISVSDLFLPTDAMIVETRGRVRGSSEAFRDAGAYDPLGLPLVVLVSESTASAAEIVAGALQDHDMALIVGEPTWGKGLVQTVFRLSYDAGLALTTARYYTPSGRLIQRDYSDFYGYAAHSMPELPTADGGAGPADSYFTDLQRTVYGGGGIQPDVLASPGEPPAYLQYLVSRDAFFQFAVDRVNQEPLPGLDWEPTAGDLAAFSAWVVDEGIADAAELEAELADAELRREVLRFLEAEAKGSQFGLEARSRALLGADRQIQAALAEFDTAADLLSRRLAAGPGTRSPALARVQPAPAAAP